MEQQTQNDNLNLLPTPENPQEFGEKRKFTNKLSKDHKKTMIIRIISSFFVILYFALIFLLGVLADNTTSSWSPLTSLTAKKVCLIIFLILPITMIGIISTEVNHIFFNQKRWTIVAIFFAFFIAIYLPTVFYLLDLYWGIHLKFINHNGINPSTLLFILVTAICTLALFIFSIVAIKVAGVWSIKNFLILSFLLIICQLALVALFYFIIKRQWTTLLYLMLIPILMDSLAYFGGILFGKRKMCPKISPKKTWEGFLIALFLTQIIIALLIFGLSFINDKFILNNIIPISFIESETTPTNAMLIKNGFWWIVFIILTLSSSIISTIGDLAFSMIKRTYKIKDFGNIIPGHGGILDRIDSHTFILVFYLFLSGFIGAIILING